MKCPYCKHDMKPGYVQASRSIIFGVDKNRLAYNPKTDKGEFFIAKESAAGAHSEAQYCDVCKKIII